MLVAERGWEWLVIGRERLAKLFKSRMYRAVAHQAPLSMGFSRQEYWSGLPFPSPRDLLNPGIKPACPVLAGGFFTDEPSE